MSTRGVMGDDMDFIYHECFKMARDLPWKVKEQLWRERRQRLGPDRGNVEHAAAMSVFQMSREGPLAQAIPKWGGEDLKKVVAMAKELRQSLEVSWKMRKE